MVRDNITILNEIGRMVEILEGIQFQDMYQESIFCDLYSNGDGRGEDNSYTFANAYQYKDTSKLERDLKIPVNAMDINDVKLDEDDEEDDTHTNNDYNLDNDMKRNQAT